jgi:hypothetical protein
VHFTRAPSTLSSRASTAHARLRPTHGIALPRFTRTARSRLMRAWARHRPPVRTRVRARTSTTRLHACPARPGAARGEPGISLARPQHLIPNGRSKVHALVTAVLLRLAGLDPLVAFSVGARGYYPERTKPFRIYAKFKIISRDLETGTRPEPRRVRPFGGVPGAIGDEIRAALPSSGSGGPRRKPAASADHASHEP